MTPVKFKDDMLTPKRSNRASADVYSSTKQDSSAIYRSPSAAYDKVDQAYERS